MADPIERPLTILDVMGVEPFTARWNALRGLEHAARTWLQYRGTAEEQIHLDGFTRAVEFLDSLPPN